MGNRSGVDISFGPFSLDGAATELRRDDVEVRLRPQALRALKVLLVHSGRWVGHEQMIAEAWDGTHVSAHTVDVTVGEVKRSLQEYGTWIRNRLKFGYCLDVPRSDGLVRQGWHFFTQCTPEGVERAIQCFGQAIAESPSDFRAFDGLSTSYLRLVAFCVKSPLDVHEDFHRAHRQAVTLCGLTPERRCDGAYGRYLFDHKFANAESDFQQTIEEKPSLACAYIRLALLYGTLGRVDDAIETITRARVADPLSPLVCAMEAVVWTWRHDFETSVATGKSAVALYPYCPTTRSVYAQALEYSGRVDEALVQYQVGAALSSDVRIRALHGKCLATMGRTTEALTILFDLEEIRRSRYVDAHHMAMLRLALKQRDEALIELERAAQERTPTLLTMNVDPRSDELRADPRCRRVFERLFGACTR